MLRVPAQVHRFQAPAADFEGFTVFQRTHPLGRCRNDFPVECAEALLSVDADGAGGQPAGVDEVTRAAGMDEQLRLWELAQVEPGGAGVVQVHVCRHHVAQLVALDAELGEGRQQVGKAVRRSRLDEGVFTVALDQVETGHPGGHVAGIDAGDAAGETPIGRRHRVTWTYGSGTLNHLL